MDFLEADEEARKWLVEECLNPIMISAMKRVDIIKYARMAANDTTMPYSDEMIRGAFLDTMEFFAAGEIGEDVVTDDVCKSMRIEAAPKWLSAMVSAVRTHCLKEVTAYKIAKYSFDQMPREMLKEIILKKISEPYVPVAD